MEESRGLKTRLEMMTQKIKQSKENNFLLKVKRQKKEKNGRYSVADQADGQKKFPALHPSESSAVQMFGWR